MGRTRVIKTPINVFTVIAGTAGEERRIYIPTPREDAMEFVKKSRRRIKTGRISVMKHSDGSYSVVHMNGSSKKTLATFRD
jgi:hypothetical protein